MSTPEPGVFAAEWATAFNRLDVEAVLAHFHDEVVFTSPVEWRAKRGRRTVLAQCTFSKRALFVCGDKATPR
ncbi:MAG TPA: nuclear transport factor 2 family protein [Mycobacterium sp.]|nr:nuclear transport factor 2 family protein [Mycobacterium sp.]